MQVEIYPPFSFILPTLAITIKVVNRRWVWMEIVKCLDGIPNIFTF